MAQEHDLVPFSVSALPAGPWLVFAPHPDDETFGMGGSLLLAQQQGIAVTVVFVTDGGQDFNSTDPNLVDVRAREAHVACTALGVHKVEMWQEPDRGLSHSARLQSRIINCIEQAQPQHIFVPSCLEFHPDHRTLAHLVWDALSTLPQCPARIVSYDITTLGPCNLLIDISSVVELKKQVMALYKSQVGSQRYVELVNSLNTARTLTLPNEVTAAESFYVFEHLPLQTYAQAIQCWFALFVPAEPPRLHAQAGAASVLLAHGSEHTSNDLERPLISVIVRTHNRLHLLPHALKSLAQQNAAQLQVIVVNDGGASPASVLAHWQTSFAMLELIENETPRGRAAAANQGLALVRGDYFIWLDDDDWLDPQHLSNLLKVFSQQPNLLAAYAGVRVVNTHIGSLPDGKPIAELNVSKIINDAFDRNRLFFENYLPIHSVLVRRQVLDLGLCMDESLAVFEDWDFWLQLLQYTPTFGHCTDVSANYYATENHGSGVVNGFQHERRRLYTRWAKTWGTDEIFDLLTRLVKANPR